MLTGRRRRPRPAADPALLAGRPGAVHHAAGRDHARPARRHAQRRHVPDAEGRQADDADALADPQGRARGLPVRGRPARGRRRARARSRSAPYSASAPLPKHIDEFMLAGFLKGSPVELVPREDDRPRGARERRDRPRGLRRAGRSRAGGAVRRPHRLLHARRAVPGLPRHGDHDAARRDLSVDRRRQAAAGGRVARQGDGADLPAGDPDERARSSSTTTCRSRARSTTARSSRSASATPATRRR